MTELIIIKTNESERVRNLLNREKINYQVFYEKGQDFKNKQPLHDYSFPQNDKLLQEYQEAWQDPQRLAEAKQWEQAAMTDWAERAKKDKK
ncbi:MAG: hypothetical protein MRERV_52c003 [Mycoplasmataceae bacterium RV_VA103A]|nr:MAG: hypothetical protein MRERV_52c003 [Mycoplasmataceae bacterium RV_VA103A]